jgi:catechol 2,3-dioxygenase-like lactoylglutathione lyase family enzyme
MVDEHEWAPTIPELVVTDLRVSLAFYTEALGFDVMYVRGAPDFAMLQLGRVQLMLAQLADDLWITGPMDRPFGRGINLEMEHSDPEALHEHLIGLGVELYRPIFHVRRDIGDGMSASSVEFLVQDPDGYLLRFASA